MKKLLSLTLILMTLISFLNCKNEEAKSQTEPGKTAKDILGNPDYLAMSYGGYRYADHDKEPAISQLKEDLKLLAAMDIKLLRTYKVHKPQAINLLKAISELKQEDSNFEISSES